MTFLSRRKRQTTRHASPAKWATTIISTILVWLGVLSGAPAQVLVPTPDSQIVTPKFVPAGRRPAPEAIHTNHAEQVPGIAQPEQPGKVRGMAGDGGGEVKVSMDLPGPQRLFSRESEAQFYDRIRQEVKRQIGAGPAIFPEETPISRITYTSPPYPRVDPVSRLPFAPMVETVEPNYVCHRRLLFEQPNFERLGWDFGVLQPGLHIGIFCYDMAMMPYHVSSNFRVRGECNVGKCLPGDPAPFTVPIERFSVTGVIGEAGAIIGGLYLFPHN